MAALQYVDVPGYAALLLRRTYSDLALPGALMERAHAWLDGTAAVWSGDTHTWAFPSGATLTFGYLDHEGAEQRYRSAEFQYCGFDELTQFDEAQYRFMFTRLRRKAGVTIPLRMRAASNPGDVGHEWVKQRFIVERNAQRIYIPALFTDNPHVDQEGYRQSLALLDPVTRAWYERGDWDVQRQGAIAQRAWFPIVDAASALGQRARFWDLAATARSAASNDPDWTVGTRALSANGQYVLEHVLRARLGPGDLERVVLQTAQSDGKSVPVYFEQEPGAAGKLFIASLVRALAGWTVRAVPASGDKLTRAAPFFSQAQAGNVRLLRGDWNGAWLDEISAFPQGGHDDQVDSAAGAFAAVVRGSAAVARSHQG